MVEAIPGYAISEDQKTRSWGSGEEGGIYVRGDGQDALLISHPDAEINDGCLYDYVNPIFQQKVSNARGTYGFQFLYFVKRMGNTGRPPWMATVENTQLSASSRACSEFLLFPIANSSQFSRQDWMESEGNWKDVNHTKPSLVPRAYRHGLDPLLLIWAYGFVLLTA